MPEIDEARKVIGVITEIDLLEAIIKGKDLVKTAAEEIMRLVVYPSGNTLSHLFHNQATVWHDTVWHDHHCWSLFYQRCRHENHRANRLRKSKDFG